MFNFMKIRPVRAQSSHADERMNGHSLFAILRTHLTAAGCFDMPVHKQKATRRRIPKDNIFSTNAATILNFTYDLQSMTTVATALNSALQKPLSSF